jgi:hypothetical protein
MLPLELNGLLLFPLRGHLSKRGIGMSEKHFI